ncbi:MAG TPA: L,D-transpeptidase family protein [Caulobacteraceae bacterium]|nr:L,D-transpeptidase family protein [Caulobacteraceae bacterium]
MAASLVMAAALVGGLAPEVTQSTQLPVFVSAESARLRTVVANEAPELTAFYEGRNYKPLWLKGRNARPEAQQLLDILASAEQDGLNPAHYGLTHLRKMLAATKGGDATALARFEAQASRSFAAYVHDLHQPSLERIVYTEPGASAVPLTSVGILRQAAAAPSLGEYFTKVRKMHPIYEALRKDLAAHRAKSGPGLDARERMLLVNMDRARVLPGNPPKRYMIVDSASAMLWLYENGRPVDSMKVVVGQRGEQTPHMAGLIRYSLFNPYWNIPEDIIREDIAPAVVNGGPKVIEQRQLEVLSDWSPAARVIDPKDVNWKKVAAGKYQRVRQKPGPNNMMGRVKFMLPNKLGIYLHDTPNKAAFSQSNRWFSAGCVRVEDAQRLTRWLYGRVPAATGPDHKVDLSEPVPVYMTYLTLAPAAGGLETRKDIYGRDSLSLAALDKRNTAAA